MWPRPVEEQSESCCRSVDLWRAGSQQVWKPSLCPRCSLFSRASRRAEPWAAAALWRCCRVDRPAPTCSSRCCSGSSAACSTLCTSGVCGDTNRFQVSVIRGAFEYIKRFSSFDLVILDKTKAIKVLKYSSTAATAAGWQKKTSAQFVVSVFFLMVLLCYEVSFMSSCNWCLVLGHPSSSKSPNPQFGS